MVSDVNLHPYTKGKQTSNILATSGEDQIRNELVSNVGKFSSQVSHAVQQLTGGTQLNIPQMVIESVEKAAEDYDLINQLESAIAEWTAVLASAIQRETEKVTTGRGPLAEIDFW